MTEVAEQIKGVLLVLPPGDRAELAHFLVSSLDLPFDPDVETAGDAELARRAADIAGGKVVGKPADQVFAELRQKYS